MLGLQYIKNSKLALFSMTNVTMLILRYQLVTVVKKRDGIAVKVKGKDQFIGNTMGLLK